jgi:hypothetical protein
MTAGADLTGPPIGGDRGDEHALEVLMPAVCDERRT